MDHLHQLPSSILSFQLVSNSYTPTSSSVFSSLQPASTNHSTNNSSSNNDTITVSIPTDDLSHYWEPVQAFIGKGIFFTKRRAFIGFDSHVQDL